MLFRFLSRGLGELRVASSTVARGIEERLKTLPVAGDAIELGLELLDGVLRASLVFDQRRLASAGGKKLFA